MATGQDRNSDVVVDAEPFTDNDQPVETAAGSTSESDSSEDDASRPGYGNESPRDDVARSRNQRVTDKEVSDFLPLLPYKLQEGVIHGLIINAEEDRRDAHKFKANLEANVKLSHKSRQINLNFRLLNEVMGDATSQLDIAFKKSVFILLYATKYFVIEKWPVLQSFSCLMESLKTEKTKWNVVPVHTAPKKTRTYKLPMELKYQRSTDYWGDTEIENECYSFVQSILENHFGVIVYKERQLKEKRINYCEKHYQNLQKDLAHFNFKSFSYPSLREDLPPSTNTLSAQDLPQNQQEKEATPRSSVLSSTGMTPHPYSCPTRLCQISADSSQQNPAEGVPQMSSSDTRATSSGYPSGSSSHGQQYPQLPRSSVTSGRPTVSSVVEGSVANVDSYISVDGAISTSQPIANRADAVNDNIRQISVTGESSNHTPVPDDQAAENDNDCIEVIPNAASDEAEVNEKEETSRSSSSKRLVLEPEENDLKDDQTFPKHSFQ